MVSCKLYGGLGNNLFQIAATVAYGLKRNMEWIIPTKIEWPHYENQKVFYSPFLKYADLDLPVYLEPNFHYDEIPYMKDICLQGYWQSHKYFEDYKEEIIKVLNIPYELKKEWCALHYRRGDYIKYPSCHPIVSNIYLQEAQLKMMQKGIGKFMVFSDDIDYCKNYMPQFEDADYIFSQGKSEVEDLSLASSCAHQIGSNSAYSFWAYYLNRNENKIGIFPRKDKWFGKALPHIVDDLYMKEWWLI